MATQGQRHIVILVMTPAYGLFHQIRAGNMGHAAIEIAGKLHDMGSLNGYAYTFAPSPALRDWDFNDAAEALAAVTGHPDSYGYLDEITRFDVTVTQAQADLLQSWWDQMESAMSNPRNYLYCWTGWQCASSVGYSLRDAGVIFSSPSGPDELRDYLKATLRNTCGEHCGVKAGMTIIQKGTRVKGAEWRDISNEWQVLWRWPSVFFAGTRSPLRIDSPDGGVDQILWSDTREYRRRSMTTRQTPEQAVQLVVRRGSIKGAQIVPNFMIGRWYHVDNDHVIGEASLGGWYVNGDTGEVIHSQDQRVIRFDLFDGDRVVAGLAK